MSDHQKQLSAPLRWARGRKTKNFTVNISGGPHGKSAVPLKVLVRDILDYANTSREFRYILNNNDVFVNGSSNLKPKRPVGLYDTVSLPKADDHYRIFPDEGNKINIIGISNFASGLLLKKIKSKQYVSGDKIQITLHDGYNIEIPTERGYQVKDSLVLSTSGEILSHFPYAESSSAVVINGQNEGKTGVITEIRVNPGSTRNEVGIELPDGKVINTIENYIFVINESYGSTERSENMLTEGDIEDEIDYFSRLFALIANGYSVDQILTEAQELRSNKSSQTVVRDLDQLDFVLYEGEICESHKTRFAEELVEIYSEKVRDEAGIELSEERKGELINRYKNDFK